MIIENYHQKELFVLCCDSSGTKGMVIVMKNIYRYLIIIIVLITILILLTTYIHEIKDRIMLLKETNYIKVKDISIIENLDEIKVSEINKTDLKYPLDKIYKVEDKKVDLFSLSYGNQEFKDGNTLKKVAKPFASDQLYLIFRKSYPIVSLEEMGVQNEQEAYMIKQLAIWEIAYRTGEAKYGSELSYINSVRNDINLKNETIFKKAKDFVSYIENFNNNKNEDVELVPTLIVNNSNVKSIYKDGGYILGPYSYQVESAGIMNSNITVTDMNGNNVNAKIISGSGIEKTSFNPGEEIYIKTYEDMVNLKLKFEVSAKRIVPTIYEADNGDDYIVNTYIVNNLDQNLEIEWE